MPEYIEKEAFIAHEKRQMHEIHDLGILCGAQGCLNDLKKFPAADVRENVKGEWTRNRDYVVCPVCGYERKLVLSLQRGWIIPKFCEECGAQMMGGMEDG